MKKTFFAAGMLLLSSSALFAQDEVVTVTAPMPWATLRTDSLEVSVQADVARLPKNEVSFKVSRKSGGRASVLFSKTVKADEASVDAFLGKLRNIPLGGAEFLSLEWSVPGTEFKGVIEPIGAVKLAEGASALSAVRLKDGVSDGQAADVLAGAAVSEWGRVKFAAGWNNEGLFVRVSVPDGVSEVRFAIDAKCGKSAFLSWADRFVVYSADADSVYGVHYKRSIDQNAVKYQNMSWGDKSTLTVSKAETSRVIKIKWYEIGMQPFEERNVGFAAFVTGKRSASYPPTANSEIPGTWGDIRLEK